MISKAFTVAEESDRQVMYSRHAYPGVDIILDYNEDGTIDRGVVQRRLAEEGINDIVFP